MIAKLFTNACKYGDLNHVKNVYDKHKNTIDTFDDIFFNNLFITACICGHINIMDYLIQKFCVQTEHLYYRGFYLHVN